MPIHDWTRFDAGLFHHFHQNWTVHLCSALNDGVLPSGYYALASRSEFQRQDIRYWAIYLLLHQDNSEETGNGRLAVATAPPKTLLVRRLEGEIYAGKANHIKVRHRHGKIVSVVEIVSPGNKGSKTAFRTFIEKSAELIRQGVHLLVIDVLPPGKRDPHGRDSQGYINVHGISENTRRHANAN